MGGVSRIVDSVRSSVLQRMRLLVDADCLRVMLDLVVVYTDYSTSNTVTCNYCINDPVLS